MRKKNILNKLLSLVLCLAMLASYLPATALTVAGADQVLDIVSGSKKADPSTLDGWKTYFGPEKMDTEFAGAVWTDKSVFAGESDALPGVTLDGDNNFLVALSAIASNLSITGHTSAPTDTMLVLDLSGSMVDGTYEVGTIRQGNNNYQTVDGIDMSLINAMIDATNDTIHKLMTQNTNNRVGVVLYSGNSSTNQAATPGTATVVLPLGRYAGVDSEYLSVDTTYRTDALYTYRNWRWQATGESATYVAEGTAVNVSVKDGLKTESGGNVTDSSKRANGGTYIQNGLYQAMNQFLSVTDTTVPEGRPQAGTERMPVLVLMTDGAPTIATTSYTNIGDSNVGNGSSTNDRITFLTQLTAAYVRGRVASHYQENNNDEKDILFLTLGLGTENSSAATNTLYPAGSSSTLVDYWNRYLNAAAGQNVTAITGNNSLTVRREADVEAMNYVDKYFYANDAQGLIDSFSQILSEISIKAESYATLLESSGADFSGYVTFDDELGELMHVADMKGVLMSDGKGGTVLYTGKGIAQSLTTGNLGTVDTPNERGDELVRTVKERISGLTTTQAQQLIGYAYADDQLYYRSDSDWSNYIGWYADVNGSYVGFWDKDSGYENAPAGAVYANQSYGYLGVNGDSDMMHVVVMVRTDLTTLDQTVLFKIPASLLPTVQYKITLDEDDPTKVEEFVREAALPMQLVFEVGLRPDINSVNLEQKLAEHIQNGGHVHRNEDGAVTFYTNEWDIGNDDNQNGIPDPEEVEDAVVAQSHFHPALDNNRYYYTEDTVILTGNGSSITGSACPSDTDSDPSNGTGYYYDRYVYAPEGRRVIRTPIAATTLANDAQYDTENNRWYIPAGTMYHNLARFRTNKTANPTNTLGYSFFPAVFENVSKQDVYTFLGNNGSIIVAPATGFTLRKQVQGTIEGVSQYTFRVTLSDTNAVPVLTDANGDALSGVTMSAVSNGQFTVTMPANITAYISGIPVGTAVTVEELIDGDYKILDIQVAGQTQTGSASFTIPAYSKDGTQMVPVTFTNAPNGYGDLVITKDVHHELGSDPEVLASKVFTFKVTLTGDKIQAGNTFSTSTGAKVAVAQDGTLRFEDGSAITLRNEESITVYRLPEGTAYTVEESNIPDGFKLSTVNGTSANSASGQIAANETDQAAFINSYSNDYDTVELDLNVTVNKVLNGNTPDVETFEFALQQLLPDNTYPDIKVFTIRSDASSKVTTDTLELKFEKLGTYFYRIVEKTPAAPTPGMTYSTSQALFAVIVTDDDMDGKLEVAVREEANIDAFVTYTNAQDRETATDISVEAEFTNNYEVHSTNVSIHVHKDLVNNTGVDIPLTSFRFGLYEVDAEGNATGDPIHTVTASALGDATFNLLITENKDLTYIIKEIVPDPARVGMTYDPAEYVLTITVEADPEGQLSAETSIILKGQESEGEKAPVFKNTYELTPASASFTFSKALNGRDLASNETFEFYLVRTDDTYTPLEGSNAYNASYYLGSGSATIRLYQDASGNYLLGKAGTYHYKLTEIPGSAPGMTYDPAQYHIVITVTDNGNGALVASTPVIYKVGQTNPVSAAAFVNTYTVTGSGDVTIGGKKDLDGRAMVAGEFTIGLYSDAECQNEIETTANKADGTFSFSTITYTPADLGENNDAKTYTYYIKEVPGTKGGVTYDSYVHTVTVTVSHKDGSLVVTPSDNYATVQIRNTYHAKPVGVTLNGRKALSGDWSAVENQDFTFELYKADASFVISDPNPVKTATVTGNASFSMSLGYEDGQEGFYYFVLKEDISAEAGGVGYDAGEYHITVNVSDPGDGQLVATVTMYRPGTGNTTSAIFTNSYTVESTTITLEGTKTFTDLSTGDPKDMEEGQFTFLVLEGDAVAATGYNLADGTIVFSEIRYTSAGEHTYSVIEVPGDAGGIDYDDTIFTVKVNVVDNGDGTLTAAADYNEIPIAFENTYNLESAQVTLKGSKELQGDWSKVPAANKIFTFELYPADEDFNITGDAVAVTENGTDNTFSFRTLTYGVKGTHHYVLLEKRGGDNNGISYDETRIHITVEVKDDGAGNLTPEVTVSNANATITTEPNSNDRIVTVSGLKFTNSYQAGSVDYFPEAQKLYERDETEEMKEFSFVLSGEGFETQTKHNDGQGKVKFDKLTFQAPGTYTFTVKQQENLLWGFIKWDTNVYSLEIEITDDGLGQLEIGDVTITSLYGRDDLVFRNVHEDLITQKDVFLADATSVSIDGKKVQAGDTLTYQITYTNYTGTVAQLVTITDTVPAHTTYVVGSADPDAIYESGKLTWKFTNVEADAVITVSFQVKVADTGVTIANKGTVLEGSNTYETNEVTNPVDEIVKDVFLGEGTSSIDGKKVNLGDTLTYQITYSNTDDKAATVTITDTIPAHTTYVDGSADNGGIYESGKLTWNLQLAAGESETVSFQVEVIGSSVIIENYATGFDGINTFDTNVVTNPVDEIVKDVFHADDLRTSIDGMEVDKNDILHYTITYTNADDQAATVTITDTIPAHTAYVDGSADNDGIYESGKLTWTLELDAGETETVSFQVKVVDTKITVVNQAFALSGDNEYETNIVRNPVDEDIVTKNVFADANSTTSIDGKKVEKGDILYYTITYTNADDLAGKVTITDTIPEHTAYVDGSADNGGTYADGELTWTLELAAGESKTVSFQVKVTGSSTTVTNQAHAVEGDNELDTNIVRSPVVDDQISKDVFHVSAPTVSIDGQTVEQGNTLLYKVTYTNSDDLAATVTVTDVIPAHTTYVDGSADNGGTFAGNTLTWNLQLAAGESKTVSFQVKVVDTNITVINQATAVEGDNELVSNQVTNPVKEDTLIKDAFLPSAPTVSIDGKKVGKDDTLLYKITYTNADGLACEVTITDIIPAHTTYIAGSVDNGGTYADGKLTWNLQLAAGEAKTVSFKVKVNDYDATISNQAHALSGTNDLDSNIVTTYTSAPPTTPETGDSMDLALWMTLLLVSALGIIALPIVKRRIVK